MQADILAFRWKAIKNPKIRMPNAKKVKINYINNNENLHLPMT